MKAPRRFVVCIRNEGHEASLELRKIYEVVQDETAASHDTLRVIDEEGEDYLYPQDWFSPIDVPSKLEETLVELVRDDHA